MLEVDRISAGYGGVEVLHRVSLKIEPTEIVSLLGANGAGKSTFLRALSGLIPITQGRVIFNGQDLTRLAAQTRVKLGLVHVPEGRQILPNLTVGENLLLGAYAHRHDKAHVERTRESAFELFPVLRERQSQFAGSLSGGEQQMLAISRGLMARPKLLLLDEPSLGLAPLVLRQIFDVISRLRQTGISVLLVEQNAKKALDVADRGLVLRRGQISASGTAAELLRSEDVQRAYLGGG